MIFWKNKFSIFLFLIFQKNLIKPKSKIQIQTEPSPNKQANQKAEENELRISVGKIKGTKLLL